MVSSPSHVCAVHCDYRSSDEEVYQALKRATDPLTAAWEKLGRARRIAVKFNMDWHPERIVYHEGHRQQLVSDPVARATLRLLREHTRAEVFAVDVPVESALHGLTGGEGISLMPLLREMGVPYVDGLQEPVEWVDVPGGGLMFDRYPILRSLADADAVVSVQKLKNHQFMGITLCLKNLFGLMPLIPRGRPRAYYHHLVRMPYMLADLGRIYNPALNILDGLVTQAGMEWGAGEHPRICNTLVAGDQVIATDAAAAHLMGHDPQADWLTPPYHRDRNSLLVAAESGFGTVKLDEIDFQSEVGAPIGSFWTNTTDPVETVINWRKTTAEQALYYRDHHRQLLDKYANQYILLQMGEVKWASPEGFILTSRRVLAGDHPEQAMYLKYVSEDDAEGEHYEVYEHTLEQINLKQDTDKTDFPDYSELPG